MDLLLYNLFRLNYIRGWFRLYRHLNLLLNRERVTVDVKKDSPTPGLVTVISGAVVSILTVLVAVVVFPAISSTV